MTVGRRFSAEAANYHDGAGIQLRVARRLRAYLDCPASRVLEAGCGSGHYTALLLEALPGATIDALDISTEMAQEARERLGECGRVRWIHADAATFRGTATYDLVTSSSALHWLDPLDEGIANLANLLSPGGEFVCSVMVDGTLGELRESRLRVAPHKPPLGRLPDADAFRAALRAAGLDCLEDEEVIETGRYRGAMEFLDRIHRLGVTGGAVSRARVPLSRGDIRRLIEDYESHHRDAEGMVTATYRVLYLRARKPSAEAHPGRETPRGNR